MEPEKKTETPTVGRIVHFHTYDGRVDVMPMEAFPALVMPKSANHHPPIADLMVMFRTGPKFRSAVPYAETPTADHWSWPVKV